LGLRASSGEANYLVTVLAFELDGFIWLEQYSDNFYGDVSLATPAGYDNFFRDVAFQAVVELPSGSPQELSHALHPGLRSMNKDSNG